MPHLPATPAWPPGSPPRLFIDRALGPGDELPLDAAHSRYLLATAGLREGDEFRAFDNRSGEYRAVLKDARQGNWSAAVGEQIAPREPLPDLWLCLSPIERDSLALVAESACELGVRRIVPATMHRSALRRINAARLHERMIAVAQQCGRTALPELGPTITLEELLAGWPSERTLFFCDERGGAPAHDAMRARPGPAAVLIGPEAGFDHAENAAIRALPQSVPVALGPRILRAETAAIAATTLWMGAAGDWTS